jgi:exodeoxyribonuclease VII small subunit
MVEKKVAVNFEKALKDLEKIVEDLESGDLSLEESLKSFEKGIKLTRQCQAELEKAELKVQKLVEENGELKTKPLNHDQN